jgi:hypothetical protein
MESRVVETDASECEKSHPGRPLPEITWEENPEPRAGCR